MGSPVSERTVNKDEKGHSRRDIGESRVKERQVTKMLEVLPIALVIGAVAAVVVIVVVVVVLVAVVVAVVMAVVVRVGGDTAVTVWV